jgi:hypothetical protein
MEMRKSHAEHLGSTFSPEGLRSAPDPAHSPVTVRSEARQTISLFPCDETILDDCVDAFIYAVKNSSDGGQNSKLVGPTIHIPFGTLG